MSQRQPLSNIQRSNDYGILQTLVDQLYAHQRTVRRLDVVVGAEGLDVPADLMEIVNLLPSGTYGRRRLCDQLNSAIAGHAWGQVYGTVE